VLVVLVPYAVLATNAGQQTQEPPAAQPGEDEQAKQAERGENDELLSEDDLLSEDELLSDEELVDDDALLEGDELLGEDDLLSQDDLLSEQDLLSEEPTQQEELRADSASVQAHEQLFAEQRYPSATTCATCHPRQYREWSVSQHAYAQLSPLMMALQNAINLATSTTNGDFCLRCHAPVGAELKEPFSMSNLDRHPASREGITCVACHRVSQPWGKISGRLSFEEGDIFSPIYGPTGPAELERVLEHRDTFRVVTSRDQPGRAIHTDVKRFFPLTTPGFCGTCHEVTNINGFRIEEAFSSFKHSPAAAQGISCADCHMGKEQGKASEYDVGPAAVVGGVPTTERKLTNHYFAGPDSPIVHPGIFPHNVEAARFKTMREWLAFDVAAGWGTDEFEDGVGENEEYPAAWQYIDDRYDARQIIEQQLEQLAWAREQRLEVMRNGFELSDIEVVSATSSGLELAIEVANATNGHSVPTGFDAERLVYLEIVVTDDQGGVVYRSGDRDPNGDLRDTHSLYVTHALLPLDEDLFSLQSLFITRLLRGGERSQVLPVNTSVSALPFTRPETRPTILYGRPKGVRKHRRVIEPGGHRRVTYTVPRNDLTGRPPYHVSVKLRYQAVPVNLIAAIKDVGFDFGMSPREVADAVVSGGEVIWERSLTIPLSGGAQAEREQ